MLDMLVGPDGSTAPKDEDDFDEAIDRGILPAQLRDLFAVEAARVRAEIDARTGPFAATWQDFRPDPIWSNPSLPTTHRIDGEFWATGQPTGVGR